MKTRASSSEETSTSIDTNELFTDLKEKVRHCLLIEQKPSYLALYFFFDCWFGLVLVQWDGLENKSTVVIYGGGAIVAVWLSSIVVGAINSVPLVTKQTF